MNVQDELITRNQEFSAGFDSAGLPILPKLRTVVLTCGDARVDPAHILGLELGDAVVIRNNGGRVTRAAIEEIATLAFLVSAMTEGREEGFNVILMQHTQCGAERLSNPDLQDALLKKLGIDVSEYAITDQESDLSADIKRLAAAPEVPDAITVSALLYDVATGKAQEITPAASLGTTRAEASVSQTAARA
ncbi:carbonic anhydrase [Ruegeria sp. AD91A]|uniref:carbonic anhydrase n=1 Tax=Ruegeria sp. AD91A TaxID=2293862 RepID=UPI0013C2DE7B|nr:carbonic anhydrase [Ruegeria sp. AD91A]